MVSESQERMLCVVEPDQRRRGDRGVRALGDAGHRRSARSPTPAGCASLAAASVVAELPVGDAGRRLPAVRPRARRAPIDAALPGADREPDRRAGGARRRCWRCSARQHRLAPAGVRAVRPGRAVAHGAPARARPTPPCWCSPTGEAIAVVHRRQRPARGLRSADRRGRGRLRVRGQPRLRRRRAARAHQLPELRQPGEAPRRLAAGRGGRGARAAPAEALGVPVVGGNVSLYNEAPSGPIFPTPVIGMVGRLPDAAPGRAARLRRARATRSRWSGTSPAPTLAGSELAKLQRRAARGPAARRSTSSRVRAAHATRARRWSAPARVRSAHDIAEGGIAVALAECCIAGGIGAHGEPARRDWTRSPRPRGGPSSSRGRRGGVARADRSSVASAARRAGRRGRASRSQFPSWPRPQRVACAVRTSDPQLAELGALGALLAFDVRPSLPPCLGVTLS